jgi:hypothetical protein
MNVLITHECSGRIREAFRALGIDAWSCDIKRAEDDSIFHIKGDAILAICGLIRAPLGSTRKSPLPWHVIIMHPECTYLNVAGIHWNNRGRGWGKTDSALKHVNRCMDAATEYAKIGWCLENPIGLIGTRIRPADQWIQPYMFGDDASKQTGLWLHGLPILRKDEEWVKPRWVCQECKRISTDEEAQNWKDLKGQPLCHRCDGLPKLRPRWANQTDSGQNRLGPSSHRAADRARTYQGIARAMAQQWGGSQHE